MARTRNTLRRIVGEHVSHRVSRQRPHVGSAETSSLPKVMAGRAKGVITRRILGAALVASSLQLATPDAAQAMHTPLPSHGNAVVECVQGYAYGYPAQVTGSLEVWAYANEWWKVKSRLQYYTEYGWRNVNPFISTWSDRIYGGTRAYDVADGVAWRGYYRWMFDLYSPISGVVHSHPTPYCQITSV